MSRLCHLLHVALARLCGIALADFPRPLNSLLFVLRGSLSVVDLRTFHLLEYCSRAV